MESTCHFIGPGLLVATGEFYYSESQEQFEVSLCVAGMDHHFAVSSLHGQCYITHSLMKTNN